MPTVTRNWLLIRSFLRKRRSATIPELPSEAPGSQEFVGSRSHRLHQDDHVADGGALTRDGGSQVSQVRVRPSTRCHANDTDFSAPAHCVLMAP